MVLKLEKVSKSFVTDDGPQPVLRHVSLCLGLQLLHSELMLHLLQLHIALLLLLLFTLLIVRISTLLNGRVNRPVQHRLDVVRPFESR